MSVQNKALSTVKLTESAEGRLTSRLSESLQMLQLVLPAENYTTFLSTPVDADPLLENGEPNPDFIAWENLTTVQRLRRTLEQVQAYYLLFLVLPSLKEVDLGSVMSKKETIGEGSINPSEIKDIQAFAIELKNRGDKLLQDSGYGSVSKFAMLVF